MPADHTAASDLAFGRTAATTASLLSSANSASPRSSFSPRGAGGCQSSKANTKTTAARAKGSSSAAVVVPGRSGKETGGGGFVDEGDPCLCAQGCGPPRFVILGLVPRTQTLCSRFCGAVQPGRQELGPRDKPEDDGGGGSVKKHPADLILRRPAGPSRRAALERKPSSFETRPLGAPQDEGLLCSVHFIFLW
jgi:hypothetical protein